MKIKLSDYLVNFLVENNITDTFMVTGGGAMHLDDSLGHHPGMHVTFNHHEQACAIAAEGYARASGRLPLVCVTSGPGGTNAITGLIGAWLDSVPMLIISGQVKRETTLVHSNVKLRQLGDQELNIVDMVNPVTKFAVFVDDPNLIKYYLQKAIFLATSGRFGPCWLDIPLDVQSSIIETNELIDFNPMELQPECSHYDGRFYDDFINKLSNSKRPVIYAGEGIRFSQSKLLLKQFAEKYNIPVVVSWNAHDMFYNAHPLYAGRPGTVGTRGGNFNVQNSDFLIVLGCRLNIRQISYNWENFAKNSYIVMVDIDENEMKKKTIKVDMPIHADVREFLVYALNDSTHQLNYSDWAEKCHQLDLKYPPVLPDYKNNKPLNPYYFLKKIFDYFEDDELITLGNGSAGVITQQCAVLKEKMTMFTNSGCASMGYGFPAAIGVAEAFKGRRVICIDGDGSFQMNIQEMQTVAFNQYDLKVIYINNNGYSSIKQTQTNLFNKQFVGIGGGYGLTMPNIGKIAKAYGFSFFRIDSVDSIDANMKLALSEKGPVLIEAVVDEEQFFAPKLSSKVLPNGKMVSSEIDDMYPFLSKEEYESNKIK